MIGKLARLEGIPGENSFKVFYGVDLEPNGRDFSIFYPITFPNLSFANLDPKVSKTYIKGDYIITDKPDGFKDILIFNSDLSQDDKEDYLLVIIPYAAQLHSTSKKVAGRYFQEAVLEMRPGDTVEVSKSFTGNREVFMVVQAGNELFLIKKTR